MKLLKKIIFIGIIILLIIFTTIFAVLFILKNNEVNKLNQDLASAVVQLNTKKDDTKDECTQVCNEDRIFKDVALNISITYPSSWSSKFNSALTSEFTYDPEYGVLAKGRYTFTLSKNGNDLKFEKILGAVDGFPSGLKTGEYVDLGNNLLRIKNGETSTWQYVSKIDCSTVEELIEVSDPLVCYGSFFPGFGDTHASILYIDTDDSSILKETDKIALSALN